MLIHRQNYYASVGVKRKAVDPVNKVKVIPVVMA
jgi:hypothetical protein